ncbi:hypothetical protein B0H16DRAFT_1701940 [Mycena metata]|uniref:Uncharacterized protein n=1 Tax=Mycena metata TaxID=1033252 RepID=A0AAD7MFH7_9AGAR|nr:hypothetical protein B0H16DRAFT_1701940 [Mycena metata]
MRTLDLPRLRHDVTAVRVAGEGRRATTINASTAPARGARSARPLRRQYPSAAELTARGMRPTTPASTHHQLLSKVPVRRLVEFDLCLSLRRKPSRREKGKDVECGTRMARCTAERTKDTVPVVVVVDLIYENLRLRDRAQREARVPRNAAEEGRLDLEEDARHKEIPRIRAELEEVEQQLRQRAQIRSWIRLAGEVKLATEGSNMTHERGFHAQRAEQEKRDGRSIVTACRATTSGPAMWGQSWRWGTNGER